MDRNLLQKIKNYVLTVPDRKHDLSNDFCGIYLHSNSPFKLEDHRAPLHSFRAFTDKNYPLYFFISKDALTSEFDDFYYNYNNIYVIEIPTLKNIIEFNDFSINELLHWLPDSAEKLIYFQEDGFLINHGIESFKDWDFLGAFCKHFRCLGGKYTMSASVIT